MNDPVTTLTAALLHARGRFEFYATNHRSKAEKLTRQRDETPAGLDQDTRAQLDAAITDTMDKALANTREAAEIDRAIKRAVQMEPADFRIVPLDLLGAAMHCARRISPNGPVYTRLYGLAFPGQQLPAEDVRSPDAVALVGSAQHTAGRLDMSMGTRASLSPLADHMAQLIAFHETYGVPMHTLGNTDPNFSHMADERVAMRLDLIAEEVTELFEDGFGVSIEIRLLTDSLADFGTESISEALSRAQQRDGVEVADALGDIVYLCYGMALEMGYDLRRVIAEIHASNLTKLGADGVPIMREDGKVLKGPNYQIPNIPLVLGFIEHEAS